MKKSWERFKDGNQGSTLCFRVLLHVSKLEKGAERNYKEGKTKGRASPRKKRTVYWVEMPIIQTWPTVIPSNSKFAGNKRVNGKTKLHFFPPRADGIIDRRIAWKTQIYVCSVSSFAHLIKRISRGFGSLPVHTGTEANPTN